MPRTTTRSRSPGRTARQGAFPARNTSALVCALLWISGLALAARATELPFLAPVDVSTAENFATAVAAADVDGDGDLDLLSAAGFADRIAWHENSAGDGSAWLLHVVDPNADFARSVAAADVDGDGDIDLLSASSGAGEEVLWYENLNGDGSSFAPRLVTGNAPGAQSVCSADVDGDGDLDVIVASSGDDKIAWHENTAGDGSAWLEHAVPAQADFAVSVAAADLDGDGDVDLLSASLFDDAVNWYRNTDGAGGAWATQTLPAFASDPRSVTAADVDRDGDLDVIFTSSGDDRVGWLENTLGDGSAWQVRPIATGVDGFSVFAADFDRDGDVDVASASQIDDHLRWHENLAGDGLTWTTHVVTSTADGAQALWWGDVDGDGDFDAASASLNDDRVAWVPNRSIRRSPAFAEDRTISGAESGALAVAIGDVDRDGALDVVSGEGASGALRWHHNAAGDGTSWTASLVASGVSDAQAVALADMDADGDLDILAAAASANQVTWHENLTGDGSTWNLQVISQRSGPQGVHATDIDGDGVFDVLVAASSESLVAWYSRNGPLWTENQVTSQVLLPLDAVPDDLDADGDPDVVIVSPFSGVTWHENTGGAWIQNTISTQGAFSRAAATADLDRDGDIDVVSASFFDDTVRWHENVSGDATVWQDHVISNAVPGASRVRIGDADGDGAADVVSVATQSGEVLLHENVAGDGSQWTHRVLSSAAPGGLDAALGDLDADGDADVTFAAPDADRVAWIPNQSGQAALLVEDLAAVALLEGSSHPLLQLDLAHRGRVGDVDAELATLGILLEEKAGVSLDDAAADALFSGLRVHVDDGSGIFEAFNDPILAQVTSFALTGGELALTVLDGDPNASVSATLSRRYFLVVDLEANAAQQEPHQFRVSVRGASSVVEDRDADIPLAIERPRDESTRRLLAVTPTSDEDADGLLDVNETATGVYVSPVDTGSSPFLPDSDGDGYPDGLEVEVGTDPNDAQSFPPFAIPLLPWPSLALLLLLLLTIATRAGSRSTH